MNTVRESIQCIAAVCLLIGLLECALGENEPDGNVKLLMGLAVSSTIIRTLVNAVKTLI